MEFDWHSLYNATTFYVGSSFELCFHYTDLHYMQWLAWVFYPLVLTFILPAFIVIFLYATILFLHVYRLRHKLNDIKSTDYWSSARKIIAALWDAQGKIWHGYEIVGLEKIPDSGPALLVYYHGAIPIDMYYIMAKCILQKDRQVRAIGDRFLFRVPGFRLLMEVFCVMPGTVTTGIDLMNQGHLLAVAPGGVREAFFSDEYYGTLWGKRVGFAKIAVEAKVPVIPMFTKNCREAFRALGLGRRFFKWIYEKTRLPIVPIYGGFPVKMKTFIGDPITHDPGVTPEQLAQKVHNAVQDLIMAHQTIPGNVVRSFMERFYTPRHERKLNEE